MLTLVTTKTVILIRFILNEKEVATSLSPGMVLLDFVRYHQHLMGTKIGCREGDCGACIVLVGGITEGRLQYQSMTSCLLPLANVRDKHVVTIEGINFPGTLNPIQQAMADEGATQCGFCTPGFVVSFAGFCLSSHSPTTASAVAAVDGNICRCTGYKSIERAACKIAGLLQDRNGEDAAGFVAYKKILPDYFASIKNRLQNLSNGQSLTSDSRLPTNLIAGGTDLYVQKHDELAESDNQYLYNNVELKGIRQENGRCIIGGAATVTDLLHSEVIREAFPQFDRYAKLVSSTPIRNMATVAGNLVNASPIGDLSIFLLALDAKVHLKPNSFPKESVIRTVPLRAFYKGYKKLDKQPGEIISSISFRLPEANSFFNFEKVSKRTHLDIASVNSAIHLVIKDDSIENAGLSAGGVGPVPLYLQKTSKFLVGKKVSEELIDEAIAIMQTEITPISDARGSKEYKTLLLGQLIRAHALCLPKGRT